MNRIQGLYILVPGAGLYMDDSGAEILPPAKGVLWMTHAETVHLVLSQNAVDDSGAEPVFWG